jgi:hypothetical protein
MGTEKPAASLAEPTSNSPQLRRARDEIERGKLKQALSTLSTEGAFARASKDRVRLDAVIALVHEISENTSGRLHSHASELLEYLERALVADATPRGAAVDTDFPPVWALVVVVLVLATVIAVVVWATSVPGP